MPLNAPNSPYMNICFEHRADRPNAQSRFIIRLVATFDNQRLRLSTGEKCRAAEWNDKSGWFRKSFSDLDNATIRLNGLRKRDAWRTHTAHYARLASLLLLPC